VLVGLGGHDRLGLVVRDACGAVGASNLRREHVEHRAEAVNDRAINLARRAAEVAPEPRGQPLASREYLGGKGDGRWRAIGG
jgi:hypothetical protein